MMINKRELLYPQHFYNIFTTNFRWQVIISSNLNSQLKLLFYPSITTNNNLPHSIYCESVLLKKKKKKSPDSLRPFTCT